MQYSMDKVASAYELALEKVAIRQPPNSWKVRNLQEVLAKGDEASKKIDKLRRGATHAADTSKRWGIKPDLQKLSSFEKITLEHLEELLKSAALFGPAPGSAGAAAIKGAKKTTEDLLSKAHSFAMKRQAASKVTEAVGRAAPKVDAASALHAFRPKPGAPSFGRAVAR